MRRRVGAVALAVFVTVGAYGGATASAADALSPPSSVSAVKAVGSADDVVVTWNDTNTRESGYVVERRKDTGPFAVIAQPNRNATRYDDMNLATGTYAYRVRARGKQGAASAYTNAPDSVTIGTPPNQPPTANAGPDKSAPAGSSVTFNGSATDPDGTIISHTWSFGDGTPNATGATVTHTYASAGTFTATLTVTDNRGASANDTAIASISATPNQPPSANAGADKTVTAGVATTLTGTGTDPDGTIAAYTWSFGDGTPAVTGSASVSHAYATPGTYNATLTVTDNRGATGSDMAVVNVVSAPNQPPTANAGADKTATAGTPLTLTGSGSDPDGTITAYAWSFGDGTPNGSGATVSHTYASAGSYTAMLTVTDNRGATASDATVVTVAAPPNQLPTATAGADKAATAGSPVTLTGSGTDPDGTITGYTWSFGDGTPTATGASVSHTYASAGTYTATLTVTDNRGATASDTALVTVGLPPNQPPTANAGADRSATAGSAITLTGSGTDPDGTITAYAWSFGDGTPNGSGATVTHTYASAGTYTATLTVTDNRGATASDSGVVSVTPSAPAVGAHIRSQRFGGAAFDSVYDLATGPNNTVAITGEFNGTANFGGASFTSVGGGDVFVAKYDTNGNHLWSRAISGSASDRGEDVAIDSTGDVYVVGTVDGTADFGNGVATSGGKLGFIAKYDGVTGAHEWSRRFSSGGSAAYDVAVGPNNEVAVGGQVVGTVDFGGGPMTTGQLSGTDLFVAKYTATGGHTWSRIFQAAGIDVTNGLSIDTHGNVVAVGSYAGTIDFGGGPLRSPNGWSDAFIVKFGPAGEHVWSKNVGNIDDNDFAVAVATDASDNVIVGGTFKWNADFGGGVIATHGASDWFVAKYTAGGAYVFAKALGSQSNESLRGVATDPSGNIFASGPLGALTADLGGSPLPTDGTGDFGFVKMTASGTHVWSRRLGHDGAWSTGIATDGAGRALVVGGFPGTVDFGGGPRTSAGGFDAYVAVYGP